MNIYTLIFILVTVAMASIGAAAHLKNRKVEKTIKDGLRRINAEPAMRREFEPNEGKGAGLR